MKQIYVQSGKDQQGPLTEEQVRALYNSGAISMDSHYWHDGMDGWPPITELTEAEPSIPEQDVGELRVADCLIKWNCPYCKERVSLDFKLLEQINEECIAVGSLTSKSETMLKGTDHSPLTLPMVLSECGGKYIGEGAEERRTDTSA